MLLENTSILAVCRARGCSSRIGIDPRQCHRAKGCPDTGSQKTIASKIGLVRADGQQDFIVIIGDNRALDVRRYNLGDLRRAASSFVTSETSCPTVL